MCANRRRLPAAAGNASGPSGLLVLFRGTAPAAAAQRPGHGARPERADPRGRLRGLRRGRALRGDRAGRADLARAARPRAADPRRDVHHRGDEGVGHPDPRRGSRSAGGGRAVDPEGAAVPRRGGLLADGPPHVRRPHARALAQRLRAGADDRRRGAAPARLARRARRGPPRRHRGPSGEARDRPAAARPGQAAHPGGDPPQAREADGRRDGPRARAPEGGPRPDRGGRVLVAVEGRRRRPPRAARRTRIPLRPLGRPARPRRRSRASRTSTMRCRRCASTRPGAPPTRRGSW